MNPALVLLALAAAGAGLWAVTVKSKKKGIDEFDQGKDVNKVVPINELGEVVLKPGNMGTVHNETPGALFTLVSTMDPITLVESNNSNVVDSWNGLETNKASLFIRRAGTADLLVKWGSSISTLRVVRTSPGAEEL